MDETTKAQELFSQFAGKTIETVTVWADANQRVLRELVELYAGTAQEGLRLYSELSRSAIDAIRDGQEGAYRWQATVKDAAADPAAWSQKAVGESTQYAQQAVRRVEENMQAVTRSAERLQTSMEQAGKGIQESLAGAVSRLKTLYGDGGR
jgi:hypothetical protein